MKNIARYYLLTYLLFVGIILTFFPKFGLNIFLSDFSLYPESFVQLGGVMFLGLFVSIVQLVKSTHKSFVFKTLFVGIVLTLGLVYVYSQHRETFILMHIGLIGLSNILNLLSLKYE